MFILGGSINSQLGKGPVTFCKCSRGGVNQQSLREGSAKTLQGLPQTVLILGGGQLTVTLGRIHKDFARITSDSVNQGGVNQQSTLEGSAKTLQGLPQTVLILGVNQQSNWEGSAGITSDSVDPGGSINSQIGKDL